ncbi:MAG: NHL repeat-containing protein [bacterium]
MSIKAHFITLFRLVVPLVALAISGPLPFSPCSAQPVEIIRCRRLFSLTGTKDKPFNQPSAVSVFKDRIMVLDGVNSRVVVYDHEGGPLFQFGKAGSDPGEFKSPLGLTVDHQGRMYVADSGNHRIQVFDPNGKLLTYFILKGDRYGCPADPTDLTIDHKHNRLLVVDNDNHRFLIYTLEGSFVKEVGEVGFENGQFRYPYGIAMDQHGKIYVVDVLNTRVQVFDFQGEFLRSIGEWGIEKGQFFRPQGIAVDHQGRVFVSESYQKIGVIQAFSPDGEFLALLGDRSRKKLRFSVPTDLFFDDHDRLYVCEMHDSRVSVYELEHK